jgi:hypothetical protein
MEEKAMATDADPIVGNWYAHLDKGQRFEVVAVDEDAGTVEVQYFDGAVEEVDLGEWYELDVEPAEAPEDWTGPMDDLERDDLGYSDTGMEDTDWRENLKDVPNEAARGVRVPEDPEEPVDEESEIELDEEEE